jgi:transposase
MSGVEWKARMRIDRARRYAGNGLIEISTVSSARRIYGRKDRSPGCGNAGAHGRIAGIAGAPGPKRGLLELKELYVAREALVKDRTAAKNRGKVLTLPLLKRQNAQRLEQINRQIAIVEAAILQIVEADAAGLADRFAIPTSIPGVSNIPAFAPLIEMPELGALEAGQAASLVWLAPIARQSGRWNGRAFIRGGRGRLRHALYMPRSSLLASIPT